MDHSVEVTGSGAERGPAGVLCYLVSPCATASVILVKALWAFWGEPGSPLAITLFLECSERLLILCSPSVPVTSPCS